MCFNFILFVSIRKYVFLSICFYLFLINSICGQQDNEFWFAAPDLQEIHGDDPILLRISTGNEPANITILQPANPDFSPINIQLSAFSSKSVDLTPFKSIIECDKINQKQNKGLLIKSNCFINCYYDIANQYNGDLFALKGQNALGTKFTIPFQMSFIAHAVKFCALSKS